MAEVYQAFDTRLERYVALKVIRSGLADAGFLKRFEREAKALAKLSHPNIVHIIDYGDQENQPFLVMEYVSGGTLRDLIGKPMPPAQAARWLAPVACALDYAHQRKIVHRDVKPANVLISQGNIPMLSDFGIAKMIETEESLDLTGSGTIGTPEYMAPEQVKNRSIDPRSDIYSLGIVFYEMVTGQKPFRGETALGTALMHLTDPLPNPRQFSQGLSDAVVEVIFKALHKDPAQRFSTAGEFAQVLAWIADGEKPPMPVGNAALTAPPAEKATSGQKKLVPESPIQDSSPQHTPSRSAARDQTPTSIRSASQPPLPEKTISPPAISPPIIRPGTQQPQISRPGSKAVYLWAGAAGLLVIIPLLIAGIYFLPRLLNSASPAATNPVALLSTTIISTNNPGEATPSLESAVTKEPAETFTPTSPPSPTQILSPTAFVPVFAGTTLPETAAAISLDTVQQFTRLARLGMGIYEGGEFSPDGNLFAVHTTTGKTIFETTSWTPILVLESCGGAEGVAISPDWTYAAAGSCDGKINLYQLVTASPPQSLGGHRGAVLQVRFANDGMNIASWDENGKLIWWETGNGELLNAQSQPDSTVLLSPTGDTFTTYEGSTIHLYRTSDGNKLRDFNQANGGEVNGVKYSPDGTRLVSSGSDSRSLWYWRMDSSDAMLLFTTGSDINTNFVTAFGFSPDNRYLVYSTQASITKIVNLETRGETSILKGYGSFSRILFSPNSSLLLADKIVWKVPDDPLNGSWEQAVDLTGEERGLAFSNDGGWVMAGNRDALRLWGVGNGQMQQEIPFYASNDQLASLVFSNDSTRLLTGTSGYRRNELRPFQTAVQQWSFPDGILQYTFTRENTYGAALGISPDGSLAAAGVLNGDTDQDHCIYLWTTATGAEAAQISTRGLEITSLAFSPAGDGLAVGAQNDQKIRIYNAADLSFSLAHSIQTSGTVNDLAYSPDGSMLAAGEYIFAYGDSTGEVQIWNASEGSPGSFGTLIVTLGGHPARVNSVSFSSDGQVLATADEAGTIRLFEVPNKQPILELKQTGSSANSVVFSLDGTLVMAGFDDGSICLWNTGSGELLATLKEHSAAVTALKLSPDGKLLASASIDGSILLWGIPR